jgi:hypothetical protein
MEFIETPTFTRLVLALMDDDEYSVLQTVMSNRPDIGKVIRGGGGIRKMRWAGSGRGKRGGLRIIYYWLISADQIWMLLAYAKKDQDDLTPEQLRTLKMLMKEFEP